MPRINQDIQDIKHLVLLRKALLGRKSVEIYSREPSMRLTIGDGSFHGGDCVETIRMMIEKPLPLFDWENLEQKARFVAQNPIEIFSKAVASITPDHERMNGYVRIFSRLPRVRMRASSTFHADKAMQVEYQALYRLSLTEHGASVAEYLVASAGLEQLRRRTGIVIASYCLGDFVAIGAPNKPGKQSARAGVVRRILRRIRGMHQG